MPTGLFLDAAYTVPFGVCDVFYGNGTKTKFICTGKPASVYVNGVRQTAVTIFENLVTFDLPPKDRDQIIVAPQTTLTIRQPAVASFYVVTDQNAYLSGRRLFPGSPPDLELSFNNVDFFPGLLITENSQVYVRAVTISEHIERDVSCELVLATPQQFEFTAPTHDEKGVEIYAV